MFPDIQTVPDEEFTEGLPAQTADEPTFRTNPDLPVCVECGKTIPWKGKGRKPLRHPECKKPGSGKASGTSRKPRVDSDPLEELTATLQDGLGQVAGGLSALAPVTAMTTLLNGPPAVEAMVRIAARYPRVLAAFQKAAVVVPYFDIARFAGGIAAGLAVDAGRVLPEGMLMEYLHVAEAARQVGYKPPQKATEEPTLLDSNGLTTPPPPRFVLN